MYLQLQHLHSDSRLVAALTLFGSALFSVVSLSFVVSRYHFAADNLASTLGVLFGPFSFSFVFLSSLLLALFVLSMSLLQFVWFVAGSGYSLLFVSSTFGKDALRTKCRLYTATFTMYTISVSYIFAA